MKMYIEYFDRKKDKPVSKEYKSKAAFIRCLKKIPTRDTYYVIYNGEEMPYKSNTEIIDYIKGIE